MRWVNYIDVSKSKANVTTTIFTSFQKNIACALASHNTDAIPAIQLDLNDRDKVLISHLHGDHFFGLVGLISTMHLLGRDKGLTIYGPEQLEQIVRMQLEVGNAKLNFDIRFVVLNGKENCLLFTQG